jgi:hypothetical protein
VLGGEGAVGEDEAVLVDGHAVQPRAVGSAPMNEKSAVALDVRRRRVGR